MRKREILMRAEKEREISKRAIKNRQKFQNWKEIEILKRTKRRRVKFQREQREGERNFKESNGKERDNFQREELRSEHSQRLRQCKQFQSAWNLCYAHNKSKQIDFLNTLYFTHLNVNKVILEKVSLIIMKQHICKTITISTYL